MWADDISVNPSENIIMATQDKEPGPQNSSFQPASVRYVYFIHLRKKINVSRASLKVFFVFVDVQEKAAGIPGHMRLHHR